MVQVLLGIPAAIFIAAVSSWITVQLSLHKFRKERWWERKVDAYTSVIEALHNSREFTSQHIDAELGGREVNDEHDAELRAKAKHANEEIRRAASTGSFFLSDQAAARLAKLQQEVEGARNATHWFEYLESDWTAVNACLQDIIQIAKADLNLEASRSFWKRS